MKRLMEEIIRFRDARDWKQFHNAKDLSISLSIESSELFQWKNSDDAVKDKREEMCDEIADVFIYAVLLCDALHCDPEDIIRRKLLKNNQKYPVEKAFGSNKKYDEF